MIGKETKRAVGVVAIGVVGYLAYYAYATMLPRQMQFVESTTLPWVSLAIGIFVGYLVRSRGWLFAGLPILLFSIPFAIASFRDGLGPPWPFLLYKLPVGLLVSVLGGFIGQNLKR